MVMHQWIIMCIYYDYDQLINWLINYLINLFIICICNKLLSINTCISIGCIMASKHLSLLALCLSFMMKFASLLTPSSRVMSGVLANCWWCCWCMWWRWWRMWWCMWWRRWWRRWWCMWWCWRWCMCWWWCMWWLWWLMVLGSPRIRLSLVSIHLRTQ